ncbi:MAG: hypothetical protein C4554_08210 [Dethiobacter sp.]|nr:MAG: hypothetical protein C4554_08210 [Dethiobacter sp.]
MKIAIIALSRPGLRVARQIQHFFPGACLFAHIRLEKTRSGEHVFGEDLKTFVGKLFRKFEGIVMIMAAGIAVRVIAPYLENKKTDPAVVVVDDTGLFTISLLSGHLGGANWLAEEIAWKIGAFPVITTSTDRHGVLAFDLLARRMNWIIEHEEDLKKISAFQVEGKEIVIFPDETIQVVSPKREAALGKETTIPFLGRISVARSNDEINHRDPQGIVFVSNRRDLPRSPQGKPFIIMRPRNIWAGVGCRRGVAGGDVVNAVQEAFNRCGREISSLQGMVTAELKSEEPGLKEAAGHFDVPLKICRNEKIREVEHFFRESAFVRKQTGCGSVAEPCAFLGSSRGEMILEKTTFSGITVALGERLLSFRWAREEKNNKERPGDW